MTDKYIWGGGTNSVDPITNAKLNQNVDYLDEQIAAAAGIGGQFAQDISTTAGLVFGYKGGLIRDDNTVIAVDDGTLTLTDDATNYVESTFAGVVSANTSGFTSGSYPLFVVVAADGAITSVTPNIALIQKLPASVSDVAGTAPISVSGTGTKTVSISAATTSAAGSMSAADKTKLDGVASGATANSSDADLENRANHTGTQAISTVTDLQSTLDAKADLVDGKVPAAQLPSYVDDVLVYADLASFPATGEDGKLYVTEDTNLTYRWTGSTYTSVGGSGSLALGETSSTAYRGDRGKTAYDHSQLTSGNPHNVTKSDVGLSNVDNTSNATERAATATLTNKDLSSGTNTFPTFNQSTTGNAATATKLATARNINGVAFDGTTDITISASGASDSIEASEALAAGDMVNVYNSSGEKVRKANAGDTTKPATGFVTAAVSSGDDATVYFAGSIITGLSGLTPGAAQYLDTTGGGITETAPFGDGEVVQFLGTALSSTSMIFDPGMSFEL
jgi:hypothetical protein